MLRLLSALRGSDVFIVAVPTAHAVGYCSAADYVGF
jgi:hypothetical protein